MGRAPRQGIQISIHALLAESDAGVLFLIDEIQLISIHALLAESDHIVARAGNRAIGISIHALLAESDKECTSLAPKPKTFLSTLSLRRATILFRR